MQRIIIVGGGIIGMLHAWEARRRGFEVVHLESDGEPRSATVRNLGMIWVTGRAPGPEMDLVLRARAMWEEIAAEVPGVGFRPVGALTALYDDAEVRVAEQAIDRDRGAHAYQVLDREEARELNPSLRGTFAKALYSPKDAVIEPRTVLPAMRHALAGPGYQWLPNTTAVAFGPNSVRDQNGVTHSGDLVLLCVGSSTTGVAAEALANQPLQRVRLQMLETEPLDQPLTTLVSDSLSLHYYPVYNVPALQHVPQDPFVKSHGIKLMVSQRADGGLTVGDTHHFDEPFDFASAEACYDFIIRRFERLFGVPIPSIRRRWSGTYGQRSDRELFLRRTIAPGVMLATGVGGRGMGTAPAIATDTFDSVFSGTPSQMTTKQLVGR